MWVCLRTWDVSLSENLNFPLVGQIRIFLFLSGWGSVSWSCTEDWCHTCTACERCCGDFHGEKHIWTYFSVIGGKWRILLHGAAAVKCKLLSNVCLLGWAIYICCQWSRVLVQSLKPWLWWCVYLVSEKKCRLEEGALALCGPQHCRVMNDLMAAEVSFILQLSPDAHWRPQHEEEVIQLHGQTNCCVNDWLFCQYFMCIATAFCHGLSFLIPRQYLHRYPKVIKTWLKRYFYKVKLPF